ncbi:hypothetical protein GCM10027160_26530 [Streptomyces calidiresistens]
MSISTARSFSPLKSTLHTVSNVHAYRIGDHEWYTADAVWHMAGLAFLDEADVSAAGVTWNTSLLFAPNAEDSRVTVLRHDPPQPLSAAEFKAIDVKATVVERLAPAVTQFAELLNHLSVQVPAARGVPRAYEGALKEAGSPGSPPATVGEPLRPSRTRLVGPGHDAWGTAGVPLCSSTSGRVVGVVRPGRG